MARTAGEIVHGMVGCLGECVLPEEDHSRCVFPELYLCLRLFMLPRSQLNYFTLFANTAECNVRVPDFAVGAIGGSQCLCGRHKVRFENLGVIDRSNHKIAPY